MLELSRGSDRFQAPLQPGDRRLHPEPHRTTARPRRRRSWTKPTAVQEDGHAITSASPTSMTGSRLGGRRPALRRSGSTITRRRRTAAADEGERPGPASVGVKGAGVDGRQAALLRDTYYTADADSGGRDDYTAVDIADPETWAGCTTLKVLTLYVQPGHYLCLGDNSPESSDGRAWGLVPDRLMLGRALVVYYPFPPMGNRTARFTRFIVSRNDKSRHGEDADDGRGDG